LTYLIFNNLLNYSLNNSASQSVGLSARLSVGLSVGWLIDQSGEGGVMIITSKGEEKREREEMGYSLPLQQGRHKGLRA